MTSGRKTPGEDSKDSWAANAEDTDDSGADLVNDAIPETPMPEELLRSKKEFQPWHLPRKHYVRIHQWCAGIKALITDLKKLGALTFRPVAYLSLPGDELLDVRTIHGVCDREDVALSYLGFNTLGAGARTHESHLSENEVKALPRVYAQGSMVVNEALEHVANNRSLAYRRVVENGSFDIINLDFCGSVASQPPMTVGGTLEAIRALLDIQRTRRAEPWLLFLTTRVGTDVLDKQVRDRLRELTRKNTLASATFKKALEDCLQVGADQMLNTSDEDLSHPVFARSFGIGFGKWLLNLVARSNPRWKITIVSVYGYRVDHQPLDMLSLGFRFELIHEPALDSVGLTTNPNPDPPPIPSEESLASDMATAMSEVVDLDELLGQDQVIRQKITNQAAKLLVQARYDSANYLTWVEEEYKSRGLAP